MAETHEDRVKAQIKAILRAYHVYFTMTVTGGYGRSGALDFSCTVPPEGRSLGIEAKSLQSQYGRQGPTQLQYDHMKDILDAGGLALLIHEDNLDLLHGVLHDATHRQFDRARAAALRAFGAIVPRTTDPLQESPELAAPVLRKRR